MKNTRLYMFALMPPAHLARRIHQERLNMANAYGFVKALKPPVHITLFDPFQIDADVAGLFEQRIGRLKAWAGMRAPFEIQLHDYNFFENPKAPVIYIDVIKTVHLVDLHRGFLNELRKYLPMEKSKNTYHPHFTIGYRDTDPGIFPEIKTAYSKRRFREQFTCRSFYLWRHNGTNWEVIDEFEFTSAAPPGESETPFGQPSLW